MTAPINERAVMDAAWRARLRAICWQVCPVCHGTGQRRFKTIVSATLMESNVAQCHRCNGTGKLRFGQPIEEERT